MGSIDSFLICPNNPIPKNDTNTILFIFEKIQGSFISKILILQVGRVPGPSDRSAHETVYKQCVRFTMGDKMWLKHHVLVDVSSLGLKTDLAYSWLTELLDVVKHALSEHLVVAFFDSLAIKGDSLICIFFFLYPCWSGTRNFHSTMWSPSSNTDRVVRTDFETQSSRSLTDLALQVHPNFDGEEIDPLGDC